MRVGKDCVLCLTFVILSDKCYRRNDQRATEEVPLGRGSPGVSKYRISAQCEFGPVQARFIGFNKSVSYSLITKD